MKQQTKITEKQKWQYTQTRSLHVNPLQNLDLSGVEKDMNSGLLAGESGKVNDTDDTENKTDSTEIVSTYMQDKFDRRWLMLNSSQMHLENIPIPSGIQNSRSQ